jgi:hypothetical protein
MRRTRPLSVFLGALLYGAAWSVLILNAAAAALSLAAGLAPSASVPLVLLAAGIVGGVHWLAGWWPFRRPAGSADPPP